MHTPHRGVPHVHRRRRPAHKATPDEDPHAPDLWLAAREGYSFTNEAAGESVVTPGKPAVLSPQRAADVRGELARGCRVAPPRGAGGG